MLLAVWMWLEIPVWGNVVDLRTDMKMRTDSQKVSIRTNLSIRYHVALTPITYS